MPRGEPACDTGPSMREHRSPLHRLMSWAIEQLEKGRSPLEVKSQMVAHGVSESNAKYAIEHAQGLADNGDPYDW